MLAISPYGERVLVEDVQGKRLQFAHWDGSRQIEEWSEHEHGAGKKEKGHLYTRDLGGQLLEQARFIRRGGRTAHASEDDDFDEWDSDEDRRGDDGWRHGPRKPKLNHVRFVHGDFLDSAALVTNHRGHVLDRREFAPFGVPLAGNFKKMPFGYTGHRAEAQTGHWRSLHRQLDPRAGRWSQRDPGGGVDGQNRYAYVRNSALAAADPLGLRLILEGSPKYALRYKGWLEKLSGVELSLEFRRGFKEFSVYEVVFRDCRDPAGVGFGFAVVAKVLLAPEDITLALVPQLEKPFDEHGSSPGSAIVDMGDLEQLQDSPPTRDALIREDSIVHTLSEKFYMAHFGTIVEPDDPELHSAHRYALGVEAAIRARRGAYPFSFPKFVRKGPGELSVVYGNGSVSVWRNTPTISNLRHVQAR